MMAGILPHRVLEELRRIGREFTAESNEAVRRLLAPLHAGVGYLAPQVLRDRSYGPHPRHRLDVHTPAPAAAGRPVVLFVRGGGFVGGEKSDPTLPYYDHVGAWAVRAGLVAVTMTYRLAPEHTWPAGAHDVAAALCWTREHIAGHGGDPDRIVLVGHSAGATHVAGYLAGQAGRAADRVAGAVLLSGIYDPATAERDPLLEAYYGDRADQYPARSVVPGLVACQPPLLVGVAELDPPEFHRQAMVLLDALLAAHGVISPFVTILDHTHLSSIHALGLDHVIGAVWARFVYRVTAAPADTHC